MKYLAIIQARCGSFRLPGKVLKELCGKTDLEWVIERVKKSRYVDEVIVATSMNEEDVPIVKLVSSLGLRVFAGSPDDVLDRYYQAAKLIKPEYVIRITADCPVIDAGILDDAISKMTPQTDYTAALSETLADGLDIEIMKYAVLERAWKEARLASEREHVTLYIKNNPDKFHVLDYTCTFANLHDERWTLDEPQDYEFLKTVYEYFISIGKTDFDAKDICHYLDGHPEIRKINAGIIRNEGLLKSLKEDYTVDTGLEVRP